MNKIENFILPEHTNTLYEKEATSSISLTKEVADKINELIDNYNELSKTDLAWKQEQEGIIRKGVVFMKDNLLNSINGLLKLYDNHGLISDYVDKHTAETIRVLKQQITNIVSGGTSDNEVIDIRVGANGVTYDTAGESIRGQIKEVYEGLCKPNILDSVKLYKGFYGDEKSGTTNPQLFNRLTDNNEVYTDLISVKPFDIYTITLKYPKNCSHWLGVNFYDIKGVYIKRSTTSNNIDTLTYRIVVPAECYYMRLSYRAFGGVIAKLEKGGLATPIKETIDKNLLTQYPLVFDGYHIETVKTGHIMIQPQTQDGYIENTPAQCEKYSYPIQIDHSKEYNLYINKAGHTWFRVNYYKLDGAIKGVSDFTASQNGKYKLEIPAEAEFMIISARTTGLKFIGLYDTVLDFSSAEQGFFDYAIQMSTGEIITNPNNEYNVKSVAHRGYSTEAPENTLSAYRLAKHKGFKYVECDVAFTQDNIPVLLHDDTIDRTSNGVGDISQLTFETVRGLDFGTWFSPNFMGEVIPTFSEFILLCRNLGLHPYIEIKPRANKSQVESLVSIVNQCGMKGKVTYIGGIHILQMLHSIDTSARLGFVVGGVTSDIVNSILTVKGDNEVFIDCNVGLVTPESVELCAMNNIPLEIWTVNNPDTIKTINPYISGFTSDYLHAGNILFNA